MGNSISDVNDNLKAQASGNGVGPEIYKLVNMESHGELVKLMRIAVATKNYSAVDECIRTDLKKYVYNEGKGEQINIKDLILYRTNGKLPSARLHDNSKVKVKTKERCFDIKKLGAVGETILHLCILNDTDIHIELAKKIIVAYPKMVNDYYIGDEYYGEAPLHMAIVNQKPSFVRFLLLYGADVHQRCFGKFFCCDDQRNLRTNYIDDELFGIPEETNYMSTGPYLGEYPISFAAILNQEESLRLLLAKKADPNMQDSNGNTVLHMLVIYNNLKMFQLMLEFKARLDLKNRQGLTPLTLAAKLARKEIFQFILKYQRKEVWCYADVSCMAYPLETIDSVRTDDGKFDTESALYLIANGDSVKHLELLEGLVLDLFNRKWETYVRRRFYIEVIAFLVYFLLSVVIVAMQKSRFMYIDEECIEIHESERHHHQGVFLNTTHEGCECLYLTATDQDYIFRWILEIIQWAYSILFLLQFTSELYIQSLKMYLRTLGKSPFKVLFIISLLTTLLIIPFRFTCLDVIEDHCIVIAIILKGMYVLYLGKGFKHLSTFVYIIHLVIKTNLARFTLILVIFILGFSQSFYIVYDYGSNEVPPSNTNEVPGPMFTNIFTSIFDIFVMSLNDLLAAYVYLKIQYLNVVGRILFLVYVVLIGIMLINLLIAMMANTYDTTTNLKREWLRQWAKQVLIFEQSIPLKSRLKEQKKYGCVYKGGKRCFFVKHKQSEKDRDMIKNQRPSSFPSDIE